MPDQQANRRTVIVDDQELFYKRLRWDTLTFLTPLVLLLDVQIMGVQQNKQLVLAYAAFFTLLVGARIGMGVRGKRKSNRTDFNYRVAMMVLALQNAMVSSAFAYMYKMRGLESSNTAILLAVLIGLAAYVLFSFQLDRPYFFFQIMAFSGPLFSLPYFVPSIDSWAFLGAYFVVVLYFIKTIKLNGHTLMTIEEKGRVLKELSKLQSKGQGIHADRLAFLGEMASGVAHEINNPLTVIRGRAERAQKKVQQGKLAYEELPSIFESIMTQTKRASDIVSSLKKFARVSADGPIERQSLNMIVAQSLDLCFEKFKKAGLKVNVDLQYQGQIECRGGELAQIIMSLLNNAYEELITQESGDVKITSIQVEDWVELCVCDSGRGIPTDQLQKVFMPFFSTKPERHGLGLGLAVSRGVIGSHGGDLIYERIEGRSCFLVLLPLLYTKKRPRLPRSLALKREKFEKLLNQGSSLTSSSSS